MIVCCGEGRAQEVVTISGADSEPPHCLREGWRRAREAQPRHARGCRHWLALSCDKHIVWLIDAIETT